MKDKNSLKCPSYLAKPGAELFAVVSEDGKVEYLEDSIKIDQTFVDAAQQHEVKTGYSADERFRFAGKCIQGGCHQWSHEHSSCSLITKIIDVMNRKMATEPMLQPCAIRKDCRWYSQEGSLACANCTETVRNMERSWLDLQNET